MSPPATSLKIAPWGCLLLALILIGLPCLAVWYFGVPSLLLTFLGLAAAVFFWDALPTKQQWRFLQRERRWFWGVRAVLLAALSLCAWAALIYLNYFKA